ncbi:MAG TPA: hypothetical protein ACFCUD_10740 [Cyclobacteriaceae bacterium]
MISWWPNDYGAGPRPKWDCRGAGLAGGRPQWVAWVMDGVVIINLKGN